MSPVNLTFRYFGVWLVGLVSFSLLVTMPSVPTLAQVAGIPAFNVIEGDGEAQLLQGFPYAPDG